MVFLNKTIQFFEFFFAVGLLIAVSVSVYINFRQSMWLDWGTNQVFYDFIYRILLLVIGLELARLLITHNLNAVLELIAFVIARKTLKPDVDSFDIFLIVVSFFLLMIARLLIAVNIKELLTHKYGGAKK